MNPEAVLTKPAPAVDSFTEPFWQAAAEHRLMIQRCTSCDRYQHTPVALCPICSSEMGWADVSGRGQLYTFTIMRMAYHPAFAKDVPYNVAVVELDEGPFMVTNVVDCANEDLRIGMRLEVVFDDATGGFALPKFAPAESL